ncbi:hypothetical protein JTB14_033499 [Gonioctena quinquepunctata]|nr:hypothetical protein JTB14_033499 [Gonioctena quinquepunctata]
MTKESWKIVKNIESGPNIDIPHQMKTGNGKHIQGIQNICNEFNNYTTNLSIKKQTIENIQLEVFAPVTLFLTTTTPEEIQDIPSKTSKKAFLGIDNIPDSLLKSGSKQISTVLSHLINE